MLYPNPVALDCSLKPACDSEKEPEHPHRRKDKGCEPLTVQRKCTDVAAWHGCKVYGVSKACCSRVG